MVLSKRERHIAVITAGLVALAAFYYFAVSPYMDASAQLAGERADVVQKQHDADELFERKRQLDPIWAEMQKSGLKTDAAQADSQAQHALLDWAQWAGVNVDVLKPGHPTMEGKFMVLSYELTASGSMETVSKLVWAMETATIPVRLNELTITPHKEGTNDLSIRLSLSTLCMPAVSPQGNRADKTLADSAELTEARP